MHDMQAVHPIEILMVEDGVATLDFLYRRSAMAADALFDGESRRLLSASPTASRPRTITLWRQKHVED